MCRWSPYQGKSGEQSMLPGRVITPGIMSAKMTARVIAKAYAIDDVIMNSVPLRNSQTATSKQPEQIPRIS